MSPLDVLKEKNEKLARQINQEARNNPESPYARKFVGIANGQVVAVADSWTELLPLLRKVEPDPQKTTCLEADLKYEEVEEIWAS